MFKKIIIVGGGPAGTAAADALAASGMSGSVAIVERGDFGGTCTNRGCIPTKFLLARGEPSAAPGEAAARAAWTRTISHKNALVKGLSRSIDRDLAAKGVEIVRGAARFIGPNAVEVVDAAGNQSTLEAATVILASGSEPAHLASAPFDGGAVVSSTTPLPSYTQRRYASVASGLPSSFLDGTDPLPHFHAS